MSSFFNFILFQPLFNVLVLIYNLIPGGDFGVAIATLTVLIRLAFSPLSIKAIKSQKELSQLQPKIKEIQVKYKNDKTAQAQATMALYREHNVNPFSGCLPLLIQIPILIALYRAFDLGLKSDGLSHLYRFVHHPEVINPVSLGFIDLLQKSPLLAIAAGALQFMQSQQAYKFQNPQGVVQTDQAAAISKQMLYFSPLMVIIISWNLPTGLTIYWIVTTLYSIIEQLFINHRYKSHGNKNPGKSNN